MRYSDKSGRHRENAEKSLKLAAALFPGEEWVYREPNIHIARSRLQNSAKERAKLVWEIDQVRVLTKLGSVVYFLPEHRSENPVGILSADAVIDGEIVEIKTVSGTRATLGHEFKKGYKQGASLCRRYGQLQSHSVFIRLFPELSPGSVKAKIAGELKTRLDKGSFICYFEAAGELYIWSYEELRALICRK
jgi:hypothetical protein